MTRASLDWTLARWNDTAGYWLTLLVPVALVSATGLADVFSSIVAILFAAAAIVGRDGSWLRRPWVACLGLLWLYLCVRGLLADHAGHSVVAAFIWLRYVVFALALGRLLQAPGKRDGLIMVLVGSVLFLSADTLLQYVTGFDIVGRPAQYDNWVGGGTEYQTVFHLRLSGPFSRLFVGTIIAWLFLPPLLWLVDRRRWRLATLLGLLSVLAVALSGERMALVTLGLEAIFLVILLPRWRGRLLIALGALALLLCLALLARPALYERQIVSTWQLATHLGQSSYGVIWHGAWSLVAAHPLFGIGVDNYRKACTDPALGPLLIGPNAYPRCSTHPHNFYLEWLLSGGIPALGLFIAAMILLLRDLLRGAGARGWLFAGLAATILVRLWPLGPTTSFFHSWFAIPLFLYVGIALSYLPAPGSRAEKTGTPGIEPAG